MKKKLTARDAQRLASRLIRAVDDHDSDKVTRIIAHGYEPSPGNYLVILGVVAGVVAAAAQSEFESTDDDFFTCGYPDDAPASVRYAAQITSTAANGDMETAGSLGLAILHECHEAESLDLFFDVITQLLDIIHHLIHPGAHARPHPKG